MVKLLLATGNQNKVRELQALLADEDWDICSLADFPQIQLPPEDGESFAANALIKGLAAAEESGLLTMADDSGLTVEALDGAPGIMSARFAGEDKDDEANNSKLLSLMAGIPKGQRQAAFCCSIAVVFPDGAFFTTEGVCSGEIAFNPQGDGGFGYDPLFYLPQMGKTMAQLSGEEKNQISHRGRALRKALDFLAVLKDDLQQVAGKVQGDEALSVVEKLLDSSADQE